MKNTSKQSFVLWGGYIIASVILELIGFYVSAVLGTILFGACLAGAVMLALGRSVELLDRIEEKYPFFAHVLVLFGKADVFFSVLILPWIGRAFVISMGWQWDGFDETYINVVVLIMAFVWGGIIALSAGRLVMKKFFGL